MSFPSNIRAKNIMDALSPMPQMEKFGALSMLTAVGIISEAEASGAIVTALVTMT